ncbi:MAG: PAS domain S-box protein [Chloroflexota bacterium]
MYQTANQEIMDEAGIKKRIKRSRNIYGAMAVLLSLVLAIFSYNFFHNNEGNLRNRKYSELSVISNLKIKQIVDWRSERLADVTITANDPFFVSSMTVLNLNPADTRVLNALSSRLRQIIFFSNFKKIFLLSPVGKILAGSNNDNTDIGAGGRLLALTSARLGKPSIGDISMNSNPGPVFLDFAAPILDEKYTTLGILIFRVDPNEFLFPIIQSWPLPSRTAETLLVSKEGDSALYLNPLRKRADPPLTIKIPLSSVHTPGVEAVLGKTGIFEGLDYAGDQVLADLQPVPGSNWFMVAKIDDSEAYAEVRQQSALGSILTFLVILVTLSGTAVYVSYRQRHIYMDMFHAEQEKRLAQEEIRATLYGIGDGVIATDSQGRVTRLNPVAEKLTGWAEAEAAGKPLEEVFRIINENSRQIVENPVQRVIQEGKVVGLANHTLLISRDGTEHAIADSASPIHADDGSLAGVVLVFRDQEAEREAQKKLTASQKKFSTIFESSPDAIYLATVDGGVILDSNLSASDMTGYSRDEMIGRSVRDLGLWTNPQERIVYIEMLRKNNRVLNFETRFTSKTGRQIYTSIAGGIIQIEKDEFALSVVRDISDLKEAREEKKEQETLLRALIDNAPFEIWARDNNRVCILENRTLVEHHGSILGTTPEQLDTEPAQMAKWNAINNQAYSGQVSQVELTQDIHGEERIFDCIIAPIQNENKVTGIIGFNIDITQRKAAETALAAEKEELERSNAELEQFAYVASHDLQEPLRMVSSYMQLLEKRYKGKLDTNADEFIGFAVDGAVRMQKLINDLLSFSRVGTRGKSLVPVSCQEAFDLTIHNLKLTIEEQHAVVTSDKLPDIKGDSTQLVQLFQNLAANAIKFHGKQPPVIHLSVTDLLTEWEFAMTDNGIGIDPKHFNRVFVLFQRLHERSAYPGTGIGLAICKKIVQRHGGRIWVESEIGKGTTFFFTFPKL